MTMPKLYILDKFEYKPVRIGFVYEWDDPSVDIVLIDGHRPNRGTRYRAGSNVLAPFSLLYVRENDHYRRATIQEIHDASLVYNKLQKQED